MKKVLLYVFIITPFLSYSQEELVLPKVKKNSIYLNSYISIESNNLNTNFLNSMLYGGFITDEIKDNWINSGDEKNRLNAEFTNYLKYEFLNKYSNSFYFQFSDVNYVNCNFKDDLLKLSLYGNYDYLGDTLDFSETSIRIDRYQQYKLGYNYNILKNNINWSITTALSFLNGNHHMQLNIDKGSLYTSEMGTSLDLNYHIKSMMTDTSDFSPFVGNGNGIAMDFSLKITKETDIWEMSIRDLGYIKWKENSIINNTDNNLNFTGVEIQDFNNLPDFNDSILDMSFSQQTKSFKSFIPARITLSYNTILKHRFIKNICIATHSRWQPYYVTGSINSDLINRGLKESGYMNRLDINTLIDAKYLYTTVGINRGGFTDKTNLHFNIRDKKGICTIGSYHLNDFFKNDKNSASVYFSLTQRF
ncbi:MAG: hypothetical protein CMD02_01605 [Flavobacteriales bacterium]|nr:hypothetical protein [Flavobacteriales bacterium]